MPSDPTAATGRTRSISTDRNAWTDPTTEAIADGVFRVPLPMPGDALKAVNVYAIEQRDGLTLIDGGWAQAGARDVLESSLRVIGAKLSSINRILVTHAHRDHYTLAVMLRREFGMPIALGAGEKETITALTTEEHVSFHAQMSLLRGAGADALVRKVEQNARVIDAVREGWEMPDEWLDAGRLDLGKRELIAVPTPGHTRGHMVFADLDHKLLFSGDHVLPHITPSIGVEAAEAQQPLADFLESLSLVRQLPDLRLLPAHGPVTKSSHARVDELIAHHDSRLTQFRQITADGGELTAHQLASRVGWTRHLRQLDELDTFNQVLAVGETIAHLQLLTTAGRIRSREVEGVTLYSVPPVARGSSLAETS